MYYLQTEDHDALGFPADIRGLFSWYFISCQASGTPGDEAEISGYSMLSEQQSFR
jgi:hypothetical protein